MNIVDQSTVTFVERHGGDYSIVDAARISYGRRADQYDEAANKRLIRRLITSGHVSTLFIPGIVVRIHMPIFVMREFVRHRIGIEFNELSRRYRDSQEVDVEYLVPDVFREQSSTDKQRSGGAINNMETQREARHQLKTVYAVASQAQRKLEELGVAREQARMVMPVGAMTEIYARLSFAAVCRVYGLRVHPAAQKEICDMVAQFDAIMWKQFPIAWPIWREVHDEQDS